MTHSTNIGCLRTEVFGDRASTRQSASRSAGTHVSLLPLFRHFAMSNFQSPNAIPPRTSSTGLSSTFFTPEKPVLRPVSEGNWISNKMASSSETLKANGLLKGNTTWTPDKEKIVLGPYDYMYDRPGKDIRKQLMTAFNLWLKVPDDRLAIISKVIAMLHTASLLYVTKPCFLHLNAS